jgi:hypothetical protein
MRCGTALGEGGGVCMSNAGHPLPQMTQQALKSIEEHTVGVILMTETNLNHTN